MVLDLGLVTRRMSIGRTRVEVGLHGHTRKKVDGRDPKGLVVSEVNWRPVMADGELGGELSIGVIDLFISFNVLLGSW